MGTGKKLPAKMVAFLRLLSLLLFALSLDYANLEAGYAPVQPIYFRHLLHAGENKIPCQYCHVYARRSEVAGVPSVQRCMGCHRVIAADRPEIKKIKEYYDNNQPIPWIKVYDLADFVYFSHKRHVSKEVACQECHGPVETMDRIEKYSSLTMGWCLSCHKKRDVDMDCLVCHK